MSACSLHTRSNGPEGAPSIVFLHGFLGRGADWDGVIEHLAASYRCVTIDLPGHGKSLGLEESSYRFDGAADAVRATLVELNIRRPKVVGYSMGARLGLFLGLRFPDECDGLVLESGSPGLRSTSLRAARIEHDRAVAVRLASMPMAEFLKEWYQQPVFRSLARQPEVLQERIRGRMQNNPVELAQALEGMGRGSQPSLWKDLPGLQVPAVFVAGQNDRKHVEIARRMARHCHGTRFDMVPDAGHAVHAQQPATLARLIARDFQ